MQHHICVPDEASAGNTQKACGVDDSGADINRGRESNEGNSNWLVDEVSAGVMRQRLQTPTCEAEAFNPRGKRLLPTQWVVQDKSCP